MIFAPAIARVVLDGSTLGWQLGAGDDGGDGHDAAARPQLPRRVRARRRPEAAQRGARRPAARREGGGRRGAPRGRGRQPRQDAVLHRRQPRPAPAAARDGPVRRGLARARPRSRGRAARQQHQRIGRRARGPVLRAARHHAASTAAASRSIPRTSSSPTSSARCGCISSRRRSRRGWRCASAAAGTSRSPIRCWSSASSATWSRTRSATRSDGSVLLSCRRRGERLLLQVWDTGPGIRADERARIFEEFYQVPGAAAVTVEQKKGLGLGLAIVKRLCALMAVAARPALAGRPRLGVHGRAAARQGAAHDGAIDPGQGADRHHPRRPPDRHRRGRAGGARGPRGAAHRLGRDHRLARQRRRGARLGRGRRRRRRRRRWSSPTTGSTTARPASPRSTSCASASAAACRRSSSPAAA